MKILILSHNPITTYGNMGKTMKSLFSAFSQNELCQLYCYPTLPDVDCCNSYFRITDLDVLHSFFQGFRVKSRTIRKDEIKPENSAFENENDRVHYRVTKTYKRVLRDIMWKCAHWNNRALNDWLEQEKPDCIFAAPGTPCFLYDIAMAVSSKLQIPIVAYICDDFYFTEKKKAFWDRVQDHFLKRKMERFFSRASYGIYICDEMKSMYSGRFGVPGSVIMTGANLVRDTIHVSPAPRTITYMGNIGCNRYYSLAQIGETLDRINRQNGTDYQLHIYTDDRDPDIHAMFDRVQSIRCFGFLRGEAYERTFSSSELLLHVEAFDSENIDLVRYSVSTKIPDYLASGIPVFAYGPETVASMKHLIRSDCAITAVSKEELQDALLLALTNEEERKRVAQNGLKAAREFHNACRNSQRLRTILSDLCNGGEANLPLDAGKCDTAAGEL